MRRLIRKIRKLWKSFIHNYKGPVLWLGPWED